LDEPRNPYSDCLLFDGIQPGEYFYFTHSYVAPTSDFTVATTTHSITFPSAVQRDNVFGVQFHPEKSSDAGLAVLRNFADLVRR
jgi:glutamine amidotransferase